MIEARSQNNLLLGVVVNRTAVTPSKTNKVPITLVNTNSYHVWIKQQLLAADIVEVDHYPWDYHSTMSHDGGEVQVSFRPVPTLDVQADVLSVSALPRQKNKPEKWIQRPMEENKRKGLNLGLDLSSTPKITILRRNWHDSRSHSTMGKWSCRRCSRNIS